MLQWLPQGNRSLRNRHARNLCALGLHTSLRLGAARSESGGIEQRAKFTREPFHLGARVPAATAAMQSFFRRSRREILRGQLKGSLW